MPTIPLTKNYQEAAESLLRLVKNGTRHERQEGEAKIIEIIGDWHALDPDELDVWGGHLKFVLKDNEAKTANELVFREALAMNYPELTPLATSKTLLTIYRQEEGSETWEDVTRDFAIKASKYGFERARSRNRVPSRP